MSKQLKPVKQSMYKDGGVYDERFAEWSGYVPCICLPLTPASRRLMIEEMFHAFILCPTNNYRDMAKFALAALEKMAGEK